MWFLVSIVTFGLAFFPMFYYLIERRNQHFSRQRELKKLILNSLKGKEKKEFLNDPLPDRNTELWTASIILIFPVFWIAYFLSNDLLIHERRQRAFIKNILPDQPYYQQHINIRKYTFLTVATLGIGVIYWLYTIFNIYNNHFHEQRGIEDRIIERVKNKS